MPNNYMEFAEDLLPLTTGTYNLGSSNKKWLVNGREIDDVLVYKGSVANYDSLPANKTKGDVYNVADTGKNYVWTGSAWDDFAGEVPFDTVTSADIDEVCDLDGHGGEWVDLTPCTQSDIDEICV